MRYAKIRKMDISNGPGVRVSIFVQGCHFHCKGCFNQDTWDFKGGKEFTDETLNTLLDLCDKDYIKGLSILGGEPLALENLDGVYQIIKNFKKRYPNKTIWLWTGSVYGETTFSEVNKKFNENWIKAPIYDFALKQILENIDVLVDGPFKLELADPNLKYRGSSNQRVIDMKETLKTGNIVLKENL